jgi:hypothetical protein
MPDQAVAGINEAVKVQTAADYRQGDEEQYINQCLGQDKTKQPVQAKQDKPDNSPDGGEVSN